MGVVGEVDYKIEMNNGKVKTYDINMLKRYFHRDGNKLIKNSKDSEESDEKEEVHQAASVACVIEDEQEVEELAVNLSLIHI